MEGLEFIFNGDLFKDVGDVDQPVTGPTSDVSAGGNFGLSNGSLPGFNLDEFFNIPDTPQTNSNMPDHEYCMQDGIFNFETNLDISELLETCGTENALGVDGFEKNLDFLNDLPTELSFSSGDSPRTSEDSFQNLELFQSQQEQQDCFFTTTTTILSQQIKQDSSSRNQCTVLSEDEQVLLAREGIVLPVNVPLTREEEKLLKVVRRKIRNKISAKVSRMKKQNYVEGLEHRIKICTQQNKDLQSKVEKLQKQNLGLAVQLKKLQDILFKPRVTVIARKRPIQASSCLMVFLLSFALFILPSMGPWFDDNASIKSALGDPSSLATGRKLLQNNDILRTDYMEDRGITPELFFNSFKNSHDRDGLPPWGNNPAAEDKPNSLPTDQLVVVFDTVNSNVGVNVSYRNYNKNDL